MHDNKILKFISTYSDFIYSYLRVYNIENYI